MRNTDNHILILNRSFWPDIEATGQFLTELCEELAKTYRITAIVGRSYYVKTEVFKPRRVFSEEIFNGIEILRVRHTRFWKGNFIGRMINWLTYGLLAFIAAMKMKPRIIIVCTDPPFLGIIAMIIGRLKSVPFVYNCRDLYPDVAVEIKRLKRGFVSSIFDYLNRKAFDKARIVVPIGQSMRDRIIKAKGVLKENIRVITDWVDTSEIKPISKNANPLIEKLGFKDKFVIMYSGNIGLSQDFSLILESISMVNGYSSFYLVFIGEGAGKENLKEKAKLFGHKNVLFLPFQPRGMLSFSLGMADLHLVPLREGIAGAVVPSKIYGIMAAGRPYLAISDKDSEPVRLVKEFNCGLWAPSGDVNAIAQAIEWAINHRTELEEMGNAGRRLAETKFDKKVVVNEWFNMLDNFD